MFTEREIAFLKMLQKKTMCTITKNDDCETINVLSKKLPFGCIELDGKYIRLTPVGRDCVSEILRIQND